ncbi:hypothetical protein OG786_29040 [Streptomyces sp. NBC_00101]|uniref:hypothetical protein n=1 Tax=Streptomyces sp. NBC_00101 TaxID=2975651 RepID=UPI003244D5D9
MSTPMDLGVNVGWHYGPDGRPDPGFLHGTAWQPDGWLGHFDCDGVQHPGDLSDCDCRLRADLLLGEAS